MMQALHSSNKETSLVIQESATAITTTVTAPAVQDEEEDENNHDDRCCRGGEDGGVIPCPVSAWTLLEEERRHRQSNRPCLLQHPGLALTIGSITQLYGPAGSGKTQLALSLCVDCAFKNQRALYIGLGGTNILSIAPRRLQTMIQTRLSLQQRNQQHNKNNHNQRRRNTTTTINDDDDDDNTAAAVKSLMSNILLHWVPNEDDLLDLVNDNSSRLYKCLLSTTQQNSTNSSNNNKKITILVLDGIANILRIPDNGGCEQPNTNYNTSLWYQERATIFFRLSNNLKNISSIFHLPILIINGVTARIRGGNSGGVLDDDFDNKNDDDERNLQPALGLSWNQCVNSTYYIGRERRGGAGITINKHTSYDDETTTVSTTEDGDDNNNDSSAASTSSSSRRRTSMQQQQQAIKRVLRCKKSPSIPSGASLDFYIDSGGTFRI